MIPAALASASPLVLQRADPTREYIAVQGGFGFPQQLPPWIDSITRDLGLETYHDMRADPHVEASLSLRIGAGLEDGLHLRPPVTKGEPGFALGQQIALQITDWIAHMETPMMSVLYELYLALAYGYQLGEIVHEWEPSATQPGGLWMVPRAVKIKPHTSFAFIMDRFWTIRGVVPTQQGFVPSLDRVQLPGQAPQEGLIGMLPRNHFLLHSNRPEHSDPHGMSILRAAHYGYWFKAQALAAYLIYLNRFAAPSVIVYTDPEADPPMTIDPTTQEEIPDTRTKEEVAAVTASQIQANSSAGVPGGAKVELLESSTGGDPYLHALAQAKQDIVMAIIGQTLMSTEGEHMARAAASVHQDVFEILVQADKWFLAASVRSDLVYPLVLHNWGYEVARTLCPIVELGEGAHQDFAANAGAMAQLVTSEFFAPDQFPALDLRLGLEPRDPLLWRQITDLRLASMALAAQPPPAPVTASNRPATQGGGPNA